MDLGVAAAEARLPHHLLGVMRPAFGEGVADEHPAEDEGRAVGVEEVEEVAGPHLVDRGEQQVGLARDVSRRCTSGDQVGSGGAM